LGVASALSLLVTVSVAAGKTLYADDIVNFIGDIGATGAGLQNDLRLNEAEGTIKTQLEEDVPHPIQVNNWGHKLKLGQVAGVSVTQDDYPVIFHRGSNVWNDKTFGQDHVLKEKKAIDEDPILVLNPDTGDVLESFGKGKFYMPHGLTVDHEGNIYVTDVGLHQVKRFPPGKDEPDLVLGRAFQPGSDVNHFCKPTSVAVSEHNGDFFVADGYCNSRILKYSKDGKLKQIINGDWKVPHSLALFERADVLCIADREGQQVDCVKAGLKRPLYANQDETGQKVVTYPNMGRVYAIAGKGTALLAISGQPGVRGNTIDTAAYEPTIIDIWGFNDGLTAPHDLAISPNGDAVYVAETNMGQHATNIRKFDVINTQEDEMMM